MPSPSSKTLENYSRLCAHLRWNRAATCLKTESNQKARSDAQVALNLLQDDKNARYRLATALIHLRPYAVAPDTLWIIYSFSKYMKYYEIT